MIPNPAALQIFSEVWAEYSALVESDNHDQDVLNFLLDVELALRTLYPQLPAYELVRGALLDAPGRILPATRAALGSVFIQNSLWPVRNYFSVGGRK